MNDNSDFITRCKEENIYEKSSHKEKYILDFNKFKVKTKEFIEGSRDFFEMHSVSLKIEERPFNNQPPKLLFPVICLENKGQIGLLKLKKIYSKDASNNILGELAFSIKEDVYIILALNRYSEMPEGWNQGWFRYDTTGRQTKIVDEKLLLPFVNLLYRSK